MIRMAVSTGDGSVLWPQGVTSIQECPNDLVMAVAHANYIISTSEQLMEGEHPPHWMWAFADELQAHFERIKRKRDEKFGRGSSSDDEEPPEGWSQNELARNLR
jgi:hypothetical protein